MSLYQNAIDALICGVEDYQQGTEARYKSALRNVYAGLLLILKEKLRSMAPEMGDALIAQKIIPKLNNNGKVEWVAKGRNTVDKDSIKQRLKSLGIKLDWEKFEEISNVRNDIEHRYTKLSTEAVQEVITKAFIILTEFMTNEMDLDIKEQLGEEIYSVFINVKDIFERERDICKKSWGQFHSKSNRVNKEKDNLFCPDCTSELVIIRNDGGLECKSCGESFNYETVVEAVVENTFGLENYISIKDGGESANTACPECNRETLIVDELTCASCGESFFGDCQVCSITIPPNEIDGSGICSWCQSQALKDD